MSQSFVLQERYRERERILHASARSREWGHRNSELQRVQSSALTGRRMKRRTDEVPDVPYHAAVSVMQPSNCGKMKQGNLTPSCIVGGKIIGPHAGLQNPHCRGVAQSLCLMRTSMPVKSVKLMWTCWTMLPRPPLYGVKLCKSCTSVGPEKAPRHWFQCCTWVAHCSSSFVQ